MTISQLVAAMFNQNCKQVSFFSSALINNEHRYSAIEKEVHTIVKALLKCTHYLLHNHFQMITDQKSISFMFDRKKAEKIKNMIAR